MKILLIDVNCKKSSTGKIVYDLYTEIGKIGDEAAIAYGRGEKINEKNIFKFGLDFETYIHALLTRITGFTGCFSPLSTYRLIKFIKKFKPDIVHIHELHAYFVNIKPLINYLKKNKVKTVFTLHCEFLYTGKCGHSDKCVKWQSGCGNCPHLKDYPSTFFFDKTKHMFRQKKKLFEDFNNMIVTAPSKWLIDRVKNSFLSEKDCRVIQNGIDTDIFHLRDSNKLREKHNIQTDQKVILAIAPNIMSDIKGGRYVLELAEKMQVEKFKFIIIGVSDLSKKYPENIIALGGTENQIELAEYYSLADCFVICSKNENFPTTCLEAQCCGVPVCGFDVGGVKETFLSKYGDCIDFADLDALKSSVKNVLVSDIDHNEISDNAIKKYSKKVMCRKYIQLYHETN